MDLSVIPERQGSKYTKDKIAEVLCQYAVKGTIAATHRETNVPERTIAGWKESEWWVAGLAEARAEMQDEIDALATQSVKLGFEAANDRLENGDYKLNKDGDVVRVPVSGRDAMWIAGVSYDKLRLLRNQPTSIQSTSSTALNKLADRMLSIEQQVSAKIVDNQ